MQVNEAAPTLNPVPYFCNHEAHEEKSTKHTKKNIKS